MANPSFDVYLAGPEVFIPNARELFDAKRRICEDHGLVAAAPADEDVTIEPTSARAAAIFARNCEIMDRSRAVIANLTPFRGLGADAGTAFEVGYMFAQGKPVFAYSNVAGTYAERAEKLRLQLGPRRLDEYGMVFEDFGLADNLMLAMAAAGTGGDGILSQDVREPARRFTDLAAFTECVRLAAKELGSVR